MVTKIVQLNYCVCLIHGWYTTKFFMCHLHSWHITVPSLGLSFSLKEIKYEWLQLPSTKWGSRKFLRAPYNPKLVIFSLHSELFLKNSITCIPWSLRISVELEPSHQITAQPSSQSSMSSKVDNLASTWSELGVFPSMSLDILMVSNRTQKCCTFVKESGSLRLFSPPIAIICLTFSLDWLLPTYIVSSCRPAHLISVVLSLNCWIQTKFSLP